MSPKPMLTVSDDCERPRCTQEARRTYRDDNGNSIRLCQRHYYHEVTGSIALGTELSDLSGSGRYKI